MNRRSFLGSMLKAGVAAAFLPGAGRLWKSSGLVAVTNPLWIPAPYEVHFLTCAEFAHLIVTQGPIRFTAEQLPFVVGPIKPLAR